MRDTKYSKCDYFFKKIPSIYIYILLYGYMLNFKLINVNYKRWGKREPTEWGIASDSGKREWGTRESEGG